MFSLVYKIGHSIDCFQQSGEKHDLYKRWEREEKNTDGFGKSNFFFFSD